MWGKLGSPSEQGYTYIVRMYALRRTQQLPHILTPGATGRPI